MTMKNSRFSSGWFYETNNSALSPLLTEKLISTSQNVFRSDCEVWFTFGHNKFDYLHRNPLVLNLSHLNPRLHFLSFLSFFLLLLSFLSDYSSYQSTAVRLPILTYSIKISAIISTITKCPLPSDQIWWFHTATARPNLEMKPPLEWSARHFQWLPCSCATKSYLGRRFFWPSSPTCLSQSTSHRARRPTRCLLCCAWRSLWFPWLHATWNFSFLEPVRTLDVAPKRWPRLLQRPIDPRNKPKCLCEARLPLFGEVYNLILQMYELYGKL